ncbi:hypothetical protein [Spongiactinospora rosea]|uniref:hypothetical protein n=1 Tax=Spongiactinospora rosea TaxID=2248750 RepID=UPI0018F45FF7|nr:hypothetical protein [Spongiactinospora rosea]
MNVSFGLRPNRILASTLLGFVLTAGAAIGAGAPAAHATETPDQILLQGSTKASYFWDDASGRAGDTGLPAIGKPMEKGMFASPSWPLGTEGYVTFGGKKAEFFIGDRGPGVPSNRGIMLDIDAKTFADLTGGTFNPNTLMVVGNGGRGHINVEYTITKWGKGPGKKNYPVAFSTGAWSKRDPNPAEPPKQEETRELNVVPPKPARKPEGPAVTGSPLSVAGAAPYHRLPAADAAQANRDASVQPAAAESGRTVAGADTVAPAPANLALLAGLGAAGAGLVAGRNRVRRLLSDDSA